MGIVGSLVATVGHLSCIGILGSASFTTGIIKFSARTLVKIISFITGAAVDVDVIVQHKERYLTFQQPSASDDNFALPHPLLAYESGTGGGGQPEKEPFQVLDEAKTLEKVKKHFQEKETKLPIHFGDEQILKQMAKRMIAAEFGCLDTSLLADDFQFVFPVVGPLTKDEFVEAFSSFKVRDGFPNARANWYNFKVDPLEPNRIWAMGRGSTMQEGTLNFGPMSIAPKKAGRSAKIHLPPQMFSFSFDSEGKCYKFTGGYCVDRTVGDTYGMGGLFGILHAIGAGGMLPFAEGQPWNKSTRSLNWEIFSLRIPQIGKDWKRALSAGSSV